MTWIEMSRDEEHGGSGWGFRECLWAPSRKKNGSRWNFWHLVRQVRRGDVVVHLRGKTGRAAFVGFSVADADGAETTSRPPQPKDWGFAETFYRVPLSGYESFPEPVLLQAVFQERETELRLHFQTNRLKKLGSKEKLFYVIQKNRLQCFEWGLPFGVWRPPCCDLVRSSLRYEEFSKFRYGRNQDGRANYTNAAANRSAALLGEGEEELRESLLLPGLSRYGYGLFGRSSHSSMGG